MNNVNKPVDIGCLEAIESLYAWLDNELDNAEMAAKLEYHISHCKSCWSRAEMEKALTDHIKRSVGNQAETDDSTRIPKSLQTRLGELIRKL